MDDASKNKNGKFQHLVDYCLDLYNEFKDSDYRKKVLKMVEKSKAAANQDVEPTQDPWPGAMNLMLPFTAITNANLAPRLAAGLVGKWPYVRLELPNDQPKDDFTEITEAWYNQELQDVVDIDQVAIDTIEKLLEEGTVFELPKYELEESIRRDFQFGEDGMPVLDRGVPVTIDKSELEFEGCRVDVLPITDVFIPDNVDDEEWDSEPVIRHIYPTYGDLQREKDYPGYIKENINKSLLKEETRRKLDDEDQNIDQERDDVKVTSKEVIKCIECSVSYVYQKEGEEKEDIKDWSEERMLVTIALESKMLIRKRLLRDVNWKNTHLVRRVSIFRKKGESYGSPMFAKLQSIQEGANKVFNTAINIAEILIIPYFFYTSRLGLKGGSQDHPKKLTPGEGIEVDNINEILFPRFNVNPDQLFKFLDVFSAFWERIASIGDLQIGRTDDTKSTATEVLAVIQEGNIKHNYQSRPIRSQFVSLLRTIYDLYYQHMPIDKTFYWNKQQVQIPRAAMNRPHAFRLTASTEMSNKLIERREKEDLWRMAQEDVNRVWNPIWVAKELVKTYNVTNPDEAINPQINQIVQQIQAVPQAAELFEQAFQQAMAIAQQNEQQGKAQGSAVVQKAMAG